MTGNGHALVCVDEETGEIVEPDGAEASAVLGSLDAYAETWLALAVTRSNVSQRLEAIAELDETLTALRRRQGELERALAAMEDGLDQAFSADLRRAHGRAISIDIGTVRVTWGKPPERWTQRVKPEAIAKRDPDLAAQLGIECKVGDPPTPRVTVRTAGAR
jgi:hypothetical protein